MNCWVWVSLSCLFVYPLTTTLLPLPLDRNFRRQEKNLQLWSFWHKGTMHFALQHASMQHASPYLICNAMPSCCQLYLPCSIAANYYLACTSLSRAGLFSKEKVRDFSCNARLCSQLCSFFGHFCDIPKRRWTTKPCLADVHAHQKSKWKKTPHG